MDSLVLKIIGKFQSIDWIILCLYVKLLLLAKGSERLLM